jgi:hypothetical protein
MSKNRSGPGGGGGGFSWGNLPPSIPTSPLPGYTAWYDATKITGVADGASLTRWPDLSANHYDLTASGSAEPNYYKTNVTYLINGLPVVYFNGTDSLMASPAFTLTQPFTICFVLVWLNTSSVSVPFASGDGNFQVYSSGAAGHPTMYAGNTVNVVEPVLDGDVHSNTVLFQHSPIDANYWMRDGGYIILPDSSLDAGANGTTNGIMVGGTPGNFMEGSYGEVIVYDMALTTEQTAFLHLYFLNKWATFG